MADNVAITAGTGTTIAADDIGAGVLAQRVKLSLGADGTGVDAIAGAGVVGTGVQRVTIANDDYLLCSLPPTTATFTPAATSHTANDAVGAAQTLTTVGASGKQVMIVGATFSIDTTTPVASAFRLHLFNAAPTVIADDAAFNVASTDGAKYLGWIDLGTAVDLGSTWQFVAQDGLAKPILLSTANLTVYLQNLTTVTLEAVAHKVTVFTVPMS